MTREDEGEAVRGAERSCGARGTGASGESRELAVGDDLAARDGAEGFGESLWNGVAQSSSRLTSPKSTAAPARNAPNRSINRSAVGEAACFELGANAFTLCERLPASVPVGGTCAPSRGPAIGSTARPSAK